MLGGYKIIDFGGANFASANSNRSIKGVYAKLESTINKPFMVKNFKIGGVEQPPFYAWRRTASGRFVLFAASDGSNNIYFRVSSDDNVIYYVTPITSAAGDMPEEQDGPSASM